MSKRLTDTTKWQDAWFMDLPSKYKLFWLYICDNCDHAGIWKVNFKVASFHIGEHLEPSEVKRILSGRLKIISDEYWMIEKFINFQYGGVKNDPVGKSIQTILNRHKINFETAPSKPLQSPLQGAKDKDKDKDKDNTDSSELEEWQRWGQQILEDNDQFWHAMHGRKITKDELDAFLSVATRNGWRIESQQSFRIALNGFRIDSGKTSQKNRYKIQ